MCSAQYAYIGPYMYGMSHMHLGYPASVWDNIMSHMSMANHMSIHALSYIAILRALQASTFVYKITIN